MKEMERDPSKRRVKPIENYQQILDIVDLEDDSSDDSDFKIDDKNREESENDDSAESSTEGTGEASDDEANGAPPSPEEIAKPALAEILSTSLATNDGKECVSDLIEKAKQAKQRIVPGSFSAKMKVLICSVCLSDASGENDEIVECDCCGVSVHESCYGISDSDSAVSTTSSCSTEPWFCDACKAGNTKPHCELCPNPGGIFKETDVGKWVHLVCALYIPGVAFGDVDKLSPVTLFEMPYTRWGAKACILCEDERYTCTGVCISCDAGMCKSYFHITCAQREGLLSQALTIEDIADPFFAYCKIHVDKGVMKCKRQNWLALQSQFRLKNLVEQPPSRERTRIEKKLAWHREKYAETKSQKPPPWVPTQKMPRMLTTSPSACKMLLRKAELLGISSQTHISANDTLMDVRKKWHIPPALNLEFVSYYLDRNTRMVKMQRQLDQFLQQNSELQENEQIHRKKYESLLAKMEELRNTHTTLTESGTNLWKILGGLSNQKLILPELFKPKMALRSPPGQKGKTSFLLECGTCHQSHDQHQLVKCDNCHLHYHLACLDPPLTRMPKKTKLMGWQCSECHKSDDEEMDNVDTSLPRKLRHSRKASKLRTSPAKMLRRLPSEYKMQPTVALEIIDVEEEGKPYDKSPLPDSGRLPQKGVKRKADWTEDDDKSSEGTPSCGRRSRKSSTRKLSDSQVECCCCKEMGDNTNTVMCDECRRSFHFSCLNPPVKKSPKQRGYTWHCEDCDPSDSEESVVAIDSFPPSTVAKRKSSES